MVGYFEIIKISISPAVFYLMLFYFEQSEKKGSERSEGSYFPPRILCQSSGKKNGGVNFPEP